MNNPVTEAREAMSLTLRETAKAMGVTQRFLEAVEGGIITAIPRSVKQGLARLQDNLGYDRNPNIDADYKRWVSWERAGLIGHNWPSYLPPMGEYSPFWWFRYDMMGGDNRHGFCLLLKLPPATVMRYERGVTMSMPRVIEEALEDADYPNILELADAQERWRANHG